jgi:hypothetical protein
MLISIDKTAFSVFGPPGLGRLPKLARGRPWGCARRGRLYPPQTKNRLSSQPLLETIGGINAFCISPLCSLCPLWQKLTYFCPHIFIRNGKIKSIFNVLGVISGGRTADDGRGFASPVNIFSVGHFYYPNCKFVILDGVYNAIAPLTYSIFFLAG